MLEDLHQLGLDAKRRNNEYDKKEFIFSDKFKLKFKELDPSFNIEFYDYTSVVKTSKDLLIIVPNQWFVMASFFSEYMSALKQYKNKVNALKISQETATSMKKTQSIDQATQTNINNSFQESSDAERFSRFLTDYNWWFGSKTIDRVDYYVSSILNLTSVVNSAQSYIADLANILSEHKELVEMINEDYNIHLKAIEEQKNIQISSSKTNELVRAQNTIYYGSPGTGKSYTADLITKNKNVQKVTFYPDYDYSSFVGGYKPTMEGDKIAYKFVPQIFTKIYVEAWKNLASKDETKAYYLQIEEINRGNCAEIFGDLFQLLDRDKDGFSKYEISAEEELHKYLLSINGFGGNHAGIKDGKLRLPYNLSIIATMNTSDQSLFPMDSAFKRRWDWIYVPIDYKCSSSDFTIQLSNGKSFEWLSFLNIINEEIFEITKSQDKQIGNWFIDAQNSGKVISESTFVNKVIFYLWNDVFKDEENTIFKSADGKNLTYTSFFENGTSNNLVSYILEERLGLIDINKEKDNPTEE